MNSPPRAESSSIKRRRVTDYVRAADDSDIDESFNFKKASSRTIFSSVKPSVAENTTAETPKVCTRASAINLVGRRRSKDCDYLEFSPDDAQRQVISSSVLADAGLGEQQEPTADPAGGSHHHGSRRLLTSVMQ